MKEVKDGKIELKDVTFYYPTRPVYVLKDFNMTIPAGQKIALVGHSGCGKSTITSLLLQFYNIKKGKLEIDGKDISMYDVKALRHQIGYVMQEPVLFNKTIKENILFGKPGATDEEVYLAAQKANCIDFIEGTDKEVNADEPVDKQL
jgi:ABC-type multidrug transport system fused ATPase/permease subunit